MKKLITVLAILSILSLTGCDRNSAKSPTESEIMVATFPNSRVLRSTDSRYTFLVEKDGTITEYFCHGSTVTPQTTYVPVVTP